MNYKLKKNKGTELFLEKGLFIRALLIPGPGHACFLADRYTIERSAGNGLVRAKPGCINFAGRLTLRRHHQMLTRVLESTAAGPAVTAQGFPLNLLLIHPRSIRIFIRHI